MNFPKNLTCLDFLVKIKLQIIFVLRSPDDNPCYRCFNLQMVSKNVIVLISISDINSKCSSTAEIAALKCPGARILLNDEKKFQNDFHSIILYREYTRPFAFVTFSTLFVCNKRNIRTRFAKEKGVLSIRFFR